MEGVAVEKNKITEIYSGVKNYISKKENIEELSKKRMEICTSCDKFKKTTKQCGICGCFMEFKTRSEQSVCPMQKW